MARTPALSILLSAGNKALLAESYNHVYEYVGKDPISARLKNRDLSGDPDVGSFEVKRFANATINDYGTARGAGKGTEITAPVVVVNYDVDKEIVEEVEEKDVKTYGVDGLISRRAQRAQINMANALDKAYFAAAVAGGTTYTKPSGVTDIAEIVENAIVTLETTQNDFVDGVPREMMHLVAAPSLYSALRNYLDKGVGNANVDTAQDEFYMFHGVVIEPSIHVPNTVDFVLQVVGAVAQPVGANTYGPDDIPLSNAVAFGVFFSYGTKVIAADLVYSGKMLD